MSCHSINPACIDVHNVSGGLAVGVPGQIKGLHEAWLRFGRVPWAELVLPTVHMLREGVAVNKAEAAGIEKFQGALREERTLRYITV